MKKIKFATVTVITVLVLTGGSLLATESLLSTGQVDTKIEDEGILKAYKKGKVEVIVELDIEDEAVLKVDKNEAVEMKSDKLILKITDDKVLKAYDNRALKVIIEE